MWLDLSDLPYTAENENRNLKLLEHGEYTSLLEQNDCWLVKLADKLYEKYQRLRVVFEDVCSHVKSGFFLACKGYSKMGRFFDYAVFYISQYVFYQLFDDEYWTSISPYRRYKLARLYNSVLSNLDTDSGANLYSAITQASEELNIPLSEAIELFASCTQMSTKGSQENNFSVEVDRMGEWVQRYRKHDATVLDAPLPLVLTLLEAQQRKVEAVSDSIPYEGIYQKFWKSAECC